MAVYIKCKICNMEAYNTETNECEECHCDNLNPNIEKPEQAKREAYESFDDDDESINDGEERNDESDDEEIPPIEDHEKIQEQFLDRQFFNIAVIGFPATGKSFFINRVRFVYPKKGWTCSVREEEEIPSSPSQVFETSIYNPKEEYTYSFLDCPGEVYKAGAEIIDFSQGSQSSRKRKPIDLDPKYSSCLACSDAYILFIPAGSFFNQDYNVDIKNIIGSLIGVIGLISIYSGKMNGKINTKDSIDSILSEEITYDMVYKSLLSDQKRTNRPMYVAYSKADKDWPNKDPDNFDTDPLLDTIRRHPKFFHTIANHFECFHFDFLTSFEGHDQNSFVVDYNSSYYGVEEMIKWIIRVLKETCEEKQRFKKSLSGHRAIKFRKKIDPEFRNALKYSHDKYREIV